jgi:hypothetical protein
MPVKPNNPRHEHSGHQQSGEHPVVQQQPSVEGTDPREAETLAPPPRSGLHHAVPLRKGPLVTPAIPRSPAIPSWIKGLAGG